MYMHGMYMYECMWMCKCTSSKAQTVMYEAVPHLMTVWALQMELDGHSAPLLLITDTCTHVALVPLCKKLPCLHVCVNLSCKGVCLSIERSFHYYNYTTTSQTYVVTMS